MSTIFQSIATRFMRLLDTASATNGAGMVGFVKSLAYAANTIGGKILDILGADCSVTEYGFSATNTAAQNQAALVAALAARGSVRIPAGTFFLTGPIDITGKRIRGAGIFQTMLKVPGTNTQTVLFSNGKTSAATWGSGAGFELRDLSLVGNWDGATALANNTWDNTAALVKWGAGQGVRMIDVELLNAYGHGASFYRLGYATFTRNKVRVSVKNGLHFEAPSGSDAITSTWIEDCDFNSNRGLANVYVKNGVGFFVRGSVFEDATAGVYIDGLDNRNISITHNHCEANTNGLLNFQGSGLNTVFCFNYCDHDIVRSNVATQLLYAKGNTNAFNGDEIGFGIVRAALEMGDGGATFASARRIGFFGSANLADVLGSIYWRSNNNNNASVSAAEIRAVARGNVNQNYGALEFGTGNNGLTYWLRLDEGGNLAPITDSTVQLGGPATQRFKALYALNATLSPPAAATPANNGELTFQLTSNTSLAFKVKGSDGVVRTGSIALA